MKSYICTNLIRIHNPFREQKTELSSEQEHSNVQRNLTTFYLKVQYQQNAITQVHVHIYINKCPNEEINCTDSWMRTGTQAGTLNQARTFPTLNPSPNGTAGSLTNHKNVLRSMLRYVTKPLSTPSCGGSWYPLTPVCPVKKRTLTNEEINNSFKLHV